MQGRERPVGDRVLADQDAGRGDGVRDAHPQEPDDAHDGHHQQGEAQRLGLHGKSPKSTLSDKMKCTLRFGIRYLMSTTDAPALLPFDMHQSQANRTHKKQFRNPTA